MEGWKEILKRLYDKGLIDTARLDNAVTKGLITQTERDEIVNSRVYKRQEKI